MTGLSSLAQRICPCWNRVVEGMPAGALTGGSSAPQAPSHKRTVSAPHGGRMLQAAAADLRQLEQTLAGTACTAMLTDAQGVIVHATQSALRRTLYRPIGFR